MKKIYGRGLKIKKWEHSLKEAIEGDKHIKIAKACIFDKTDWPIETLNFFILLNSFGKVKLIKDKHAFINFIDRLLFKGLPINKYDFYL